MDTVFYFQGIQPTECNFLTYNISLNKLSTHQNSIHDTRAISIETGLVETTVVRPVWC